MDVVQAQEGLDQILPTLILRQALPPGGLRDGGPVIRDREDSRNMRWWVHLDDLGEVAARRKFHDNVEAVGAICETNTRHNVVQFWPTADAS